jgi:hypothetical protein
MTKTTQTKTRTINSVKPADVAAFASYIAGTTDTAPAIRNADALISIANASHIVAENGIKAALKFEGGAQGMAIVARLALPFMFDTTDKTGRDALATATARLTYSQNEKSAGTMKSRVNKILEASKHFQPSAPDAGVIIAEAAAFVRQGLASHATINAWYQASIQLMGASKKPSAKSTAAKAAIAKAEKAEPVTETAKAENALEALTAQALEIASLIERMASAGAENNEAFTALGNIALAFQTAFETAGKVQDTRARGNTKGRKAA